MRATWQQLNIQTYLLVGASYSTVKKAVKVCLYVWAEVVEGDGEGG